MEKNKTNRSKNYVSTCNACKLCTPLGACIAFMGVANTVPLLHGSQGCATYIRRYMISHFKEPVDIASSSFSEDAAVFGGGDNLKLGLDNVTAQYTPGIIGIATTCLSETIGDDVKMFLREYQAEKKDQNLPFMVHVSSPSYRGTHFNGFHDTVRALAGQIARGGTKTGQVNLFPGLISPEDIRFLKQLCRDFNIQAMILPDYSERLDGGSWQAYQRIPEGGTPVNEIKNSGRAKCSLELGRVVGEMDSAGRFLAENFSVPLHALGLPIGMGETDRLMMTLREISGREIPRTYRAQRSRLIDAYADGHKYVSGKRAIVFGEEDLVIGMASFLSEIGITPVLCASGGKSGFFKEKISQVMPDYQTRGVSVREGMDFAELDEAAAQIMPDLLIGNSKGYKTARAYQIPLVRIGFPIHDRFGGQRIKHIGYCGTQALLDRIINTLLDKRQADSDIGFTYL